MDQIEEIVSQAQIAVAFFCNPTTATYTLVDFPLPSDIAEVMGESGSVFIGVAALVNGLPRTSMLFELPEAATAVLADGFARRVHAKAAEISRQASANWLDALFRLEDPRQN